LGDYFLATQVSNAVAEIPLTPAGIGTRDAVTAMFLTVLQAPAAKIGVVPVTMTLIILFWGLIRTMIFMSSGVPDTTSRLSKIILQEKLSLENPNLN